VRTLAVLNYEISCPIATGFRPPFKRAQSVFNMKRAQPTPTPPECHEAEQTKAGGEEWECWRGTLCQIRKLSFLGYKVSRV
jgi:hypothetical protein